MKWYTIAKTSSSLFTEDTLVQGKNSKQALETLIGKKVIRVNDYYSPFDYTVRLSDERGYHYRDRRKTVYYNVIK